MNRRIRSHEVRVISADGKQLGVFITEQAIKLAEGQGLDLVEVASNATPPVCKITDYGKYKYELSKKAQEAKKHQTVIHVKEVKLRPVTDAHDFDFKMRHVLRFLADGDKAKVTVRFKGREMSYAAKGHEMLNRVIEAIKEEGVVEVPPKMEGRDLFVVIAPKGTKHAKA